MIMHIYKLASGDGLYHRTIPGTRWTFCDQAIDDFTEDRVIGNDAPEPAEAEWCLACRPRFCTKLTPPHEYLIQHPVDKSPPLVTHLNSLPPFPGMRRSYWMGYTGAQLLLVLARHELPAEQRVLPKKGEALVINLGGELAGMLVRITRSPAKSSSDGKTPMYGYEQFKKI